MIITNLMSWDQYFFGSELIEHAMNKWMTSFHHNDNYSEFRSVGFRL